MNIHAELADWGESAAVPAEEALAAFLEAAWERLARGETVSVEELATPEVRERARQLAPLLSLLCDTQASLADHSFSEEPTVPFDPPPPPSPTGPVAPPEWDPFPGEFRLREQIGEGTFGIVWLADDVHLDRPVALKFLRVREKGDRESALEVLRNDARLLASVRHPNVLPVHAWRQPPGEGAADPCLVLPFVAGGSLAGRVRRDGPLPWALAARYVADVADGLRAVHALGIIHRDIKPANVLWDPASDEVLLTDFGIAARLGRRYAGAGTPAFMAPEAVEGQVSPALDVYGLAATLFWLTTGTPPFSAPNNEALRQAARRGLPDPDPRCAGLPALLEQVLRVGLHPHPETRPTPEAFAATLRGTLNLLLADRLAASAGGEPDRPAPLRLMVSRRSEFGTWAPVAVSHAPAEGLLRDLRRVPREPDRVVLRTGDRVRIEVESDRAGHVVVFNVGPTGNLNLLHPTEPGLPAAIPAHRPLPVIDVELTPPAGRERLFALWTLDPLPLRPDELLSLTGQGGPEAGPYRATRDMNRVQESLGALAPEARHAVVLELEHG